MSDLVFGSAVEILAALERGEASSRELLELYLARVDAFAGRLNAVVTLDAERARERADAADAARRRGERWGPLHGLPITVKDCFETGGLRTTAGTRELEDHVPERDAVAVQRLVDAGAVVFGKTNTPSWAMDWQTYNDLFGTTNNPWDTERTPGGSSGGSAAAIAAGLAPLELGSDIGGSIRIPAHSCGIYGHKPTWGIVPERGHIPGRPGSLVETDINVVGPLARSADDLALALSVLAGPLPEQARAWRLELPPPRHAKLADFRVALWFDDPDFPVDGAVRERLEAVAEVLGRCGTTLDRDVRPPFSLREAVELYRPMLASTTSVTLRDEHFAALVSGSSGRFEDEDLAAFTRAIGMRHRDWLGLHDRREHMRAGWAAFFQEVDLLLCPIAAVPAIRHDHSAPMARRTIEVDGQLRPYTDHFAWMGPIGAALLPATAAPVGPTPAGLPVGVQIVAPHLDDLSAIHFAGLLTEQIGGYRPPPGFDDPVMVG